MKSACEQGKPLRFVFFKQSFQWPLRTGNDVHTGHLMKALAKRGHGVLLLTPHPLCAKATGWLEHIDCVHLSPPEVSAASNTDATDRRWLGYWGSNLAQFSGISEQLKSLDTDVFVGVGVEVLPLLAKARAAIRVWYVADDPLLYHWTLMRREGWSWARVRGMITMVLYGYGYRRHVNAAWVVSQSDRRWLKRWSRIPHVNFIPNGVDASHYTPSVPTTASKSCAFWGKLDFPPNEHALDFFLRDVWPLLKKWHHDATFHVLGMSPPESLRHKLATTDGVVFREALPDLRSPISEIPVAVFPMISGGGVKNKVLEAAALARAICVTPQCLEGLCEVPPPPFRIATTPQQWVEEISNLWADSSRAAELGRQSRLWVVENHSWENTADRVLASLPES